MRALLVGRFQPPHLGHLRTIQNVAQRYDDVLVAVGSAQHSHEPDNPFTVGERFEMLVGALEDAGLRNVHLHPLPDLHRYPAWVRHVEALLPRFDVVVTNNPLTARLFRAAGHRVEAGRLWRRDLATGARIRARWLRGDDAWDAVPPAVRRVLERIRGPERVRALGR